MCGILAIYNKDKHLNNNIRSMSLDIIKKVRHRGPDWSGIYTSQNAILAHERLAIVDIKSGGQPILSSDKNLILAVNGEIYNHSDLRKQYSQFPYKSNSDCEVILPLYINYLKNNNLGNEKELNPFLSLQSSTYRNFMEKKGFDDVKMFKYLRDLRNNY